MKLSTPFLTVGLFLSFFFGCKSYYNDTIHYCDAIKVGVEIEAVKSEIPSFFTVDWEHPEKMEAITYYKIVSIKGNTDILNMQHYLMFKDGKYLGRDSRK